MVAKEEEVRELADRKKETARRQSFERGLESARRSGGGNNKRGERGWESGVDVRQ